LVLLAALSSQDQPNSQTPAIPPTAKSQVQARPSASSLAPEQKTSRPSQRPAQPSARKAAPAKSLSARQRSPSAPADDDVHVRTQTEMRKPKSPFLVPPDSSPDDRYGPDSAIDWIDTPPWRQSSFFGVRARGLFFVYVVDCSESMIDDDRFPRATIELRRSVMALQAPQRFEVIFYNREAIPMPGGPIPRPADVQAKNQMLSWLRLIEPDGGTDPRPAMRQALSLRPDAVFLLSDGAFPEGAVDQITKFNVQRIPIHTIDLAGGLAGNQLKNIARNNGGRYASRSGVLQGRP
jgi:hypothetical protein